MRLPDQYSETKSIAQSARMSLFQDPREEDRLCDVLKAFIEEWGAEKVIVSAPWQWGTWHNNRLGKVRLEFVTESSVTIRVDYETGQVIYTANLAA